MVCGLPRVSAHSTSHPHPYGLPPVPIRRNARLPCRAAVHFATYISATNVPDCGEIRPSKPSIAPAAWRQTMCFASSSQIGQTDSGMHAGHVYTRSGSRDPLSRATQRRFKLRTRGCRSETGCVSRREPLVPINYGNAAREVTRPLEYAIRASEASCVARDNPATRALVPTRCAARESPPPPPALPRSS